MFNHEYIGNIHIHTRHSDGAGSLREIVASAKRVGLDFICINDHDYMTGPEGGVKEGIIEDIVVLVGQEIGRRYHHYLAYDLNAPMEGDGLSPQEVIHRVNDGGGFGFLAHPFEKGMPFREKSVAYTWNDLSVKGFTGICIWNFTSRWKERVKTAFHGLFCLLFKKQTLKGPSQKTLNFWDGLCRERRVAAVGGSDAHGAFFKWGPIRFKPLSYDYLLGSINIHIMLNQWLPKDFDMAKREIFGAMRQGRLFIAHDHLGPSKGFRFDFISDDGSNVFMGEEGAFHDGDLVIELPRTGEIRLYRDGTLIKAWLGKEAVCKVQQKGVYRVEVLSRVRLFGWRPWIYSNPIYLR